MKFNLLTITGLAATAAAFALPNVKRDGISITPHDIYSSSIGVLGCKINTNRVAYFPGMPDCNNLCIKVSANGRSVNLLRIDSSASAYDISYDAWNYLKTGQSATVNPVEGGGFDATMEPAPMSACQDLIKDPSGKLAFSAPNSVNYILSCPKDSYVLYNIQDSSCNFGVNDVCTMPPLSEGNQPVCQGSELGVKPPLQGQPVTNIIYGSGKEQAA